MITHTIELNASDSGIELVAQLIKSKSLNSDVSGEVIIMAGISKLNSIAKWKKQIPDLILISADYPLPIGPNNLVIFLDDEVNKRICNLELSESNAWVIDPSENTMQILRGDVVHISFTALANLTCKHVVNDAKLKLPPLYAVSRISVEKSNSLYGRGYATIGLVMRDDMDSTAIIADGAVRWLNNREELFSFMHPIAQLPYAYEVIVMRDNEVMRKELLYNQPAITDEYTYKVTPLFK